MPFSIPITWPFLNDQKDPSKARSWRITYDSVRHKFTNQTSRRMNRNLWNHLTIEANMQTEFELVKEISDSNMINTQYLWDYWMQIIPTHSQSEQINELVSVIMNADMQPNRAVTLLNCEFVMMGTLFFASRFYIYGILFLLLKRKVKFFTCTFLKKPKFKKNHLLSFIYCDELMKSRQMFMNFRIFYINPYDIYPFSAHLMCLYYFSLLIYFL